jgi:hypothetical protein
MPRYKPMIPAPSAPSVAVRVAVAHGGTPANGKGVTVTVAPSDSIVPHFPSNDAKSGRSAGTISDRLKRLVLVDVGVVGVVQLTEPDWVGVGPRKIGPHSGGTTGSFVSPTSVRISGGVNAMARPFSSAVRLTNIGAVTCVKSGFCGASVLVGAADSFPADEQETVATIMNAAAIMAAHRQRRASVATMSPRLPRPVVDSNASIAQWSARSVTRRSRKDVLLVLYDGDEAVADIR